MNEHKIKELAEACYKLIMELDDEVYEQHAEVVQTMSVSTYELLDRLGMIDDSDAEHTVIGVVGYHLDDVKKHMEKIWNEAKGYIVDADVSNVELQFVDKSDK